MRALAHAWESLVIGGIGSPSITRPNGPMLEVMEIPRDVEDIKNLLKDFLKTRRAKITPDQVGLPSGGRRRVAGLRREEVALLAGVSVEYYVQIERGNVAGVSVEVLHAIAAALQLNEEETTHLFDLARAATAGAVERRLAQGRTTAEQIPEGVQALMDAMVAAPAIAQNGRTSSVPTRWAERSTQTSSNGRAGGRTLPASFSSTTAPTSCSRSGRRWPTYRPRCCTWKRPGRPTPWRSLDS
jgi:transcriptional regulator with XRE-family HTH domain